MTQFSLGVLPSFRPGVITDPDWVAGFARVCEEGGVESVWAVEHVLVAEDYEPLYPYSADGQMPGGGRAVMPDPLEWLSFVAASSSRLLLGTAVLILTQHSPVQIAKRVATLDSLSGGRVRLGVGIGWQKEEYAALNIPYADRGGRLDEHIDAVRALWTAEVSSHTGKYVTFSRVRSDPKPAAPDGRVPFIIGGSTPAAARRAGLRGDGWLPYVISPDDFAARVDDIAVAAKEAGRDASTIELTAWPTSWKPDALWDVDLAQRYADAGATRFLVAADFSGGAELDGIRRLVGEVQERVLGKLR
jgi:probable F420-dependent oxidoreductase